MTEDKKWQHGFASCGDNDTLATLPLRRSGKRQTGDRMRTIRPFAIALLVASSVFAAQAHAAKGVPQFDAAETCDQFSQADRHDCLVKMSADSAVTLKRAEAKALKMINRWSDDKQFKVLAKSNMKASNKAFVAYRQAKCEFEDSLVGGAIGNAHEIIRMACIADTNAQRALELIYTTRNMATD